MGATISERLQEARKNVNLSTMEVSKKTGVPEEILTELESGVHKPSTKNLLLLSEVYHVSIDWILKGEPSHPFAVTNENKDIVSFLIMILEEWDQSDGATRGWFIVQLKKAFPEVEEEMKRRGQK